MGWGKYYEDNISIYEGRRLMKNNDFIRSARTDLKPIVKASMAAAEHEALLLGVNWMETQRGRKGLIMVFEKGIEEDMIRKLRLNGWWWSKAHACWCNLDTKGNRKYATSLYCLGAKVTAVD